MKSADGREIWIVRQGTTLIHLKGSNGKPRLVMELPPGGVDELLAGLQSHTGAELENVAATEDGREVGLACKADRVLFFVNGRRVLEIANQDLGEFVNALRPKGQSETDSVTNSNVSDGSITTSPNTGATALSVPTSAELIRSRKFLDQVQVERYTITNVEPPDPNEPLITKADVDAMNALDINWYVWVRQPGEGWEKRNIVTGIDVGPGVYIGPTRPDDNPVRAEPAAE